MAKMYLYNGSESLNLIVTLSSQNFMLPPKGYHAVDNTDPLVSKFLGWYPDLSLVSNVAEEVEVVGDFVAPGNPNPNDLAETARALEAQATAQRKAKQDSLSTVAKQLEDESKDRTEIKENMLVDTAKVLETQKNSLEATAKGLEKQQIKVVDSVKEVVKTEVKKPVDKTTTKSNNKNEPKKN